MTYQKQAPDVWATPEANNKFDDHKGSTYFSLSNPEFAEIYEEQHGWTDPMPLLRSLAETLEHDLHFYMMRSDARPDIVKKNRGRLQTIVQCYYSLLGIDLATFKLAGDAIREALKRVPAASTAIIYVPLKLEPTNQSVFVDLWNKPFKIV